MDEWIELIIGILLVWGGYTWNRGTEAGGRKNLVRLAILIVGILLIIVSVIDILS